MSETVSNTPTINILDCIEVVVKQKMMIARVTISALVFSTIIAFTIPKQYRSATRILPPQQDNGLMGMMMATMSGGMAGLAGDLLGKGSSADLYVGILKSHSISDPIIDKFKLMKAYDNKYRFDTYKKLDKNVDISVGKKDGIIDIIVEDKDPNRAADIANAFVHELGKLTVKLNIIGAGNNKEYLEERLANARVDLIKSEDALKSFQSKYKALDITEQAKGTIKGVADLEARLAEEEIKLGNIKRLYTDSSQEVKYQQSVVSNILRQIHKLDGKHSDSVILGVGSIPEIGQQYLRLMREFKIQEALVELLTKQYEMSKLNQTKDVTGIQIIQKAQIPDKPVKPNKVFIVFTITFISHLMAIFAAFVIKYKECMSNEDKERWWKMRRDMCIRFNK